jgi:hypothetical protein
MFWSIGHLEIDVVGNVLAGREVYFTGRREVKVNANRDSRLHLRRPDRYPVLPELRAPVPPEDDRLGRLQRQ